MSYLWEVGKSQCGTGGSGFAVGLGWGYGGFNTEGTERRAGRSQRRREKAPTSFPSSGHLKVAATKKERWHESQRYKEHGTACATRLLGGFGFDLVEGEG